MATSETEICNIALGEIGHQRIMSLDDPTPQARYLKTFYAPTRDELLRLHPWNFATTRATLSRPTPAPAFGWRYAYGLPSDFIRLRQLNKFEAWEPATTHEIESGALLTDEEEAHVRYIFRQEDVAKFDPLFVRALAIALAAQVAKPITGDEDMATMLTRRLETIALPRAKQADAQEDRSRKKPWFVNSWLVRSRYGAFR